MSNVYANAAARKRSFLEAISNPTPIEDLTEKELDVVARIIVALDGVPIGERQRLLVTAIEAFCEGT